MKTVSRSETLVFVLYIKEMNVSAIKKTYPNTFFTLAENPYFSHSCSQSKIREVAQQKYQNILTTDNCALCISAWNQARLILIINRKCQKVSQTHSSKKIYSMTIFPTHVHPGDTTVFTYLAVAELFFQTSLKILL